MKHIIKAIRVRPTLLSIGVFFEFLNIQKKFVVAFYVPAAPSYCAFLERNPCGKSNWQIDAESCRC